MYNKIYKKYIDILIFIEFDLIEISLYNKIYYLIKYNL